MSSKCSVGSLRCHCVWTERDQRTRMTRGHQAECGSVCTGIKRTTAGHSTDSVPASLPERAKRVAAIRRDLPQANRTSATVGSLRMPISQERAQEGSLASGGWSPSEPSNTHFGLRRGPGEPSPAIPIRPAHLPMKPLNTLKRSTPQRVAHLEMTQDAIEL